MKVLILGGTRFVGKALVEEGLKRGHEITICNRGSQPEMFAQVEQLIGDRDKDMQVLADREWDIVMDTCGMTPSQTKRTAAALGDRIGQYIYISSISAYQDWIPHHITESYPLQSIRPDQLAEVESGKVSPYMYYGALKVLCEREAEIHWPGRVLNVRAGHIVGAFDYTDRLPYWVRRAAVGGTVLVPGRPDRPLQLIDVKDLAAWVFAMAEQRHGGTFNVTSPEGKLTMEELLHACRAVSNSDARFIWADELFFQKQGVQPWTEMPLWIPEQFAMEGQSEPWLGSFSINVNEAVAAGLTFRPVTETIREVYQWEMGRPDGERKAGISREKEKELLDAWLGL